MITTRSTFQSAAPPNFSQRTATDDYLLWERTGPTPPREVLTEPDQPGAVLHCPPGKPPPTGTATVFAAPPLIGPASAWIPSGRVTDSRSASQTLTLGPGHWEISLEYVSTRPLRLTAPGFDRKLPASLDFRGPAPPFPSGGEIVVDRPRRVTFTAAVESPPLFGRLIGAESLAFPLRIVATPANVERRIPSAAACGRYVDFSTPGAG